MVPVDVDALGAAYWTANGHKWLCGPKGTAVLWVREDRRERIHPLVVSHGANAVLGGRPRFRHEFDWVGTADPTGFLTLPAAIDWMRDVAAPDAAAGRPCWPPTMRWRSPVATSSPARSASSRPAPDAMLGSMAALPVPGVRRRCGRRPPRRSRDRGSDPGPRRCLAGAGRARRPAPPSQRSSCASPPSATTSPPTTSGSRPRSGAGVRRPRSGRSSRSPSRRSAPPRRA